MQIRKFEIDGKEVEFVNTSRDTRNGFAHDTTFFINGCQYGEATCHYINRTWERYAFQTVMRQAVHIEMEKRIDWVRNKFKLDKGYTKITAKRQPEFEEAINADEKVGFYRKLLKALE